MKLLAMLLLAPALAAAGPREFEGYEAYYATLPGALFKATSAIALIARTSPSDGSVHLRWRGMTNGYGNHTIEIGNGSLVIDRQVVRLAAARVFADEAAGNGDLGRGTLAYFASGWACLENTPSSASGTAVRHKSVYLLRIGGAQTIAWKLPSLFASCTNVRRDMGEIRFDKTEYRYDEGKDVPAGVLFKEYGIARSNDFAATGRTRSATFVEPNNVYKFTLEER
ncbi:MAG: hypothetical protein JSS14_04565 [Proteobacteria bacterium]|nr:hypothetical protein [Pseudomonadota bacterium]